MNAMCVFIRRNSHLIFHTAIILLYLITSLKCDVDPTLKPDLAEYKKRILNSINTVRRLHGVPKLIVNIPYSNYADVTADGILLKLNGSVTMYIPLENDKNPPTSYFHLVNRMMVPDMNLYAKKREYNPIFKWYATRRYYPGYHDENSFLKYAFYTQLIWRNSQEVAIGIAYRTWNGRTNEVVLILEFRPEGNLPNKWDENVLPAKHPIPERVDPQIMPTLNPFLEAYKARIITSINICRDIHGVPRVIYNVSESNAVDLLAGDILEVRGNIASKIYIPSEHEHYLPTGYFPLISRMEVPNMNDYAKELEYNPIYQWYSTRKLYKRDYDAPTHHKYGFYTQLIWKHSRQVAIGIAFKQLINGKYQVITYVGFYPEGNTPNSIEFKRNVLPPQYDVPPELDPHSLERATHDPLLENKDKILSSINQVREIHDVPNVQIDIQQSSVADSDAQKVLEGKSINLPGFYIPGKTKEPKGYFNLISRMQVPNMSLYAGEVQYNPIFQWYAHRKYYPGFYEKNSHHKYGFYTQLIWKNSQTVTIGKAFKQMRNRTFEGYEVVLILGFSPHGNIPDEWDENVLLPRFNIPVEVDPNNFTVLNPLSAPYKCRIFNSINRVRDLHDAPYVDYNIGKSDFLDTMAQHILDGKLHEEDIKEAYFPLISKLVVPEMNLYATERKYNPVYLWYGERHYCLDHYDKEKHPKCGFYTQLIWKDTKDVSVGITYKFNENGTYDVITYVSFWPEGNKPESWSANVLERKRPIPPDVDPAVD